MLRAAQAFGAQVVLPLTEASVPALVAVRDRFAPAIIPYPELHVIQRVGDKAAVLDAAAALGIAVPQQVRISTPDQIESAVANVRDFPVAIKPARSLHTIHGQLAKRATSYATDGPDLRRQLGDLPLQAYPVLIQRRIEGAGLGVFLLRWNGTIRARFAHRRVREKPPSGGVSVCAESVAMDPLLEEQSRALLEKLDWQGVAMVEFKRDDSTGVAYLMEINGRFWGSLQLAIDSGVDFPSLLVDLALGNQPAPVTSYRIGVRTRWWWGDMDQLLMQLRRSRTVLRLPASAPRRRTVLAQVLWPRRHQRNEVLRLSDPLPFIRETINWLLRR